MSNQQPLIEIGTHKILFTNKLNDRVVEIDAIAVTDVVGVYIVVRHRGSYQLYHNRMELTIILFTPRPVMDYFIDF